MARWSPAASAVSIRSCAPSGHSTTKLIEKGANAGVRGHAGSGSGGSLGATVGALVGADAGVAVASTVEATTTAVGPGGVSARGVQPSRTRTVRVAARLRISAHGERPAVTGGPSTVEEGEMRAS